MEENQDTLDAKVVIQHLTQQIGAMSFELAKANARIEQLQALVVVGAVGRTDTGH